VAKLPVPTVLELPNGMIRSDPGVGAALDAAAGGTRVETSSPETGTVMMEAVATAAVATASRPRRSHRGRSGIAHLLHGRSSQLVVAAIITLRCAA
jgi:hypothetical protein